MENEREVEQWLEAALARCGRVEPRPGLEIRVLATLRSERERIASQRRWWLALGPVAVATAIAVVAIVVVIWFQAPVPKEMRQTTASAPRTGAATGREDSGVSPRVLPPMARRTSRQVASQRAWPQSGRAGTREPKLERFPSPTPVNEQEEMLARYVEEFRPRAVLIARAQDERRRQNEREMAGPWPGNEGANDSEQKQQ